MELGLFVSFNSHKPKIELPTHFLQLILKTEQNLVIRRSYKPNCNKVDYRLIFCGQAQLSQNLETAVGLLGCRWWCL